MSPSLVSTTASIVPVLSPAWAARGRSTWSCWITSFTIRVASSMKMMRRTRTMSTSGVTLIPLIISSSPSPWTPPATLARSGRLQMSDQRQAEGQGALAGAAQPALEKVEDHHRRNGHEEAHRGGHQRLPDAGDDQV